MRPTNTDTQQIERDIALEGMTSEQAADLAALHASAAAAPLPVGMEEPEPEPVPDLAGELAGLVAVAVATLAPIFPSLPAIYTEQTTKAAAGAVAAVCHKRGWLQGGMFGEWGEEIACLAVCGPLALATVQGVRGDLAKHKAKAEAAKPAPTDPAQLAAPVPPPAPAASKVVTFGAPVPVEAGA